MFLNLLLHTDDRTQAYTRCGLLTSDHSLSEAAGKLQTQILFCEKGLFHLIKEKYFYLQIECQNLVLFTPGQYLWAFSYHNDVSTQVLTPLFQIILEKVTNLQICYFDF